MTVQTHTSPTPNLPSIVDKFMTIPHIHEPMLTPYTMLYKLGITMYGIQKVNGTGGSSSSSSSIYLT